MSVKQKKNHDEIKTAKTVTKAPGTRMGTVEDWRGSGGKNFEKSPRGAALRDGR